MTTLSYFFQSEAAQQVREEGREEGRAEAQAGAVLMVLERRGVAVPPEVRDRVNRCTNLPTLAAWLDRAWSVASAGELFAQP
ncbi:hypothetical protein OG709_14005 [Streptomyces sp. NBC_01267]|uniref:hypothetical protein n=1 Tax=Streptomyces sp. NBC_01267 TaxID=2903805 RepID=UPI002E321059|nr:hypothetical protein [Streptomyces sp. NBC_01267]